MSYELAMVVFPIGTVLAMVLAARFRAKWFEQMLQRHTAFMYAWPLCTAFLLPIVLEWTGGYCWHAGPPPGFGIVSNGHQYTFQYNGGYISMLRYYSYHAAVAGAWERSASLAKQDTNKWQEVVK